MKLLNLSMLIAALLFTNANLIYGQEDKPLEKAKADFERLRDNAREELATLKKKTEEAQKEFDTAKSKQDGKILESKKIVLKAYDDAIENAEKQGNAELVKKLQTEKDRFSGRRRYVNYARNLFKNYDKDGDGKLSQAEMKAVRRPPVNADLDGDGNVTQKELVDSLFAKMNESNKKYEIYAKSLIERYDKDGDGNLSKAEVKAMRRPPVGADLDGNGFITLDELVFSLSVGKRDARSESKVVSARQKYESYAKSLIENYDRDGDGHLNKAEVKAMRRPPVDADSDGNGFITLDELVDNLSGAGQKPAQKSSVPSKNSRHAPRKPKVYNEAEELRNACIRHAAKLLAHCDEDKDGRLSTAELRKMRNPPTDADMNGNGFVDKDELIKKIIAGNR